MTHIMHDATAYAGNSPGTPHDSENNDKLYFLGPKQGRQEVIKVV